MRLRLLQGIDMIVSNTAWNMMGRTVLALTPVERWSAARRLSGGDSVQYAWEHWFFITAVAALIVLIVLLWRVSQRHKPAGRELTKELFAENALRRGLSSRERQILLAIVMRSGLGRSHDIFTTVDAFDRGVTKLLAECVRTRTPDEIEQLKTEVAYLREKLGFRTLRTSGPLTGSRRPSSRDIPVGRMMEVTRRRRRGGATIRAEVVRNDDIELAVELEAPAESQAGDCWRARYTYGMSVWEFDTTVVSGAGKRLVLNHVDNVRFVNRRRFPRVAVALPALVAHFAFMRRARAGAGRPLGETDWGGAGLGAPVFVRGMVRELAGPGLRIEVGLPVKTGDRVLIAFQLDGIVSLEGGPSPGAGEGYIIEGVGQVRHCRGTSKGGSIAVELTGLDEADIDELVRITNRISAQANGAHADDEQDAPAAMRDRAVVQEV